MASSKKSPKDPQKIKRIMKSSLYIFARNGYQGTKTDQVSQMAKVSKGTLFHYYKSKANLYLETLRYALKQIEKAADYSVWTDSKDLVEMIVRGTQYKIELQLKYPVEFRLLIRAYAPNNSLPLKLQKEIQKMYVQSNQKTLGVLITPILKRMPLRKDFPLPMIEKAIAAIEEAVQHEARDFIKEHPEAVISDFEEIIAQAKIYMDILQRGFIADK
ncbi:TetR/AcrR family transcriptional regulator [Liquorilactobacillus oeni]|uniref:Putative transcription regulator (Putative) n=1 Tax=Liquorilactobacillus oeni DSM 19972 TaxID=1423777 RepID=A0A0R1M959_9LACO|nr:TetR/AcrR family transcriptional regulator [Liquorilactobacillus oeni]KRL04465.1 putative transcription regulator (putative) [Liquorilactobacillus oeni DSM 19972]